jgi:hypothetical protein
MPILSPDDMIARVGWFIQFQSGRCAGTPSYAYTVGLSAKELPELLMVTESLPTAFVVLNKTAQRLANGEAIPINLRLTDILDGADAMLIPTHHTRTDPLMTLAKDRYSDYQAWQLVWTDPAGAFPWEAAYQTRFIPLQPVLGPSPFAYN